MNRWMSQLTGKPTVVNSQTEEEETRGRAADLGQDVVLVLQDEASFSVVFVPVQLNDKRLLVQVQLTLF